MNNSLLEAPPEHLKCKKIEKETKCVFLSQITQMNTDFNFFCENSLTMSGKSVQVQVLFARRFIVEYWLNFSVRIRDICEISFEEKYLFEFFN